MKTVLDITNTRPYLSLLLLEKYKGEKVNAEAVILDELRQLLGIVPAGSRRRFVSEGLETVGELNIAFLHYLDIRPPSWLAEENVNITDQINQLIVVCRLGQFLGLYCSDSMVKTIAISSIEEAKAGLKPFRLVQRSVLNRAFMGGRTRTLWLSGVHRRTAVKADSKILSGIDLVRSLNPLEDQSYHYTAARTVKRLKGKDRPMGVAHEKASVWVSTTKGWLDFCSAVEAILTETTAASGNTTGTPFSMPFLAESVNASTPSGEAFDIAFVPPELLTLGPSDVEQSDWENAEKWAYGCEFSNIHKENGLIVAEAALNGATLGTVKIELILGGNKPKVNVGGNKEPTANDADWTEFLKLCGNTRWLKVRFDSGEVLSDSQFYRMQFRDYLFEGWSFIDLKENLREYDPQKEKPVSKANKFEVNLIGTQDSLFCWVAKCWFNLAGFASGEGYLFCDDGANEVADFIHLDTKPTDNGPPRLNLIHVKGSKSGEMKRNISVSDYEVVCGQAVKNLRALEGVNLEELARLGGNKVVARATWKDGAREADRTNVLKKLKHLGHDYRRRVIVIQPRVTKTALHSGAVMLRSGSKKMEANRLRQLHTLLLEAEMGCRALGADFHVIGSDV